MKEEELIETLKAFEEKRVEQLPENARNLFYEIMKIADERDELKEKIERLNNIINEVKQFVINSCYDYDYDTYSNMFSTEVKELLEILDKEVR